MPKKVPYDINTRTYMTWCSMKHRCFAKNYDSYKLYGGRGITVCERWLDYTNFLADMGERPIRTSIDRIDNDGDYEPSNCKWSTPEEQNRNTRVVRWIEYKGERKMIKEWARLFGLSTGCVRDRLDAKWTMERIESTPRRKLAFLEALTTFCQALARQKTTK